MEKTTIESLKNIDNCTKITKEAKEDNEDALYCYLQSSKHGLKLLLYLKVQSDFVEIMKMEKEIPIAHGTVYDNLDICLKHNWVIKKVTPNHSKRGRPKISFRINRDVIGYRDNQFFLK